MNSNARLAFLFIWLLHHPTEWLGVERIAVRADINHAVVARYLFHLDRCAVNSNEDADVEVDREGDERFDVATVTGGRCGKGLQDETESLESVTKAGTTHDFVRVLGVGTRSSVVGIAIIRSSWSKIKHSPLLRPVMPCQHCQVSAGNAHEAAVSNSSNSGIDEGCSCAIWIEIDDLDPL